LTPLPVVIPGATGHSGLLVWRLEAAAHSAAWGSGEGAFRVGGRWSSKGRRVIYTALDPSTAILEVAVHKGFKALDTVPHQLLSISIAEPSKVHVLDVASISNKNWLRPGAISSNQQAHGDSLLSNHPFLIVPSVVSSHSWNLLIDVASAAGFFSLASQEEFSLDTRLS